MRAGDARMRHACDEAIRSQLPCVGRAGSRAEARVQLGMLALAGWYRGHRVHLQRIRFVWSRGANAFDSRSASAAACVGPTSRGALPQNKAEMWRGRRAGAAGGGKYFLGARIEEDDILKNMCEIRETIRFKILHINPHSIRRSNVAPGKCQLSVR